MHMHVLKFFSSTTSNSSLFHKCYYFLLLLACFLFFPLHLSSPDGDFFSRTNCKRLLTWWNLSKHVVFLFPIFLLQSGTRHVEQIVVVWDIFASLSSGSAMTTHRMQKGPYHLIFVTVSFCLAFFPLDVLFPVFAST